MKRQSSAQTAITAPEGPEIQRDTMEFRRDELWRLRDLDPDPHAQTEEDALMDRDTTELPPERVDELSRESARPGPLPSEAHRDHDIEANMFEEWDRDSVLDRETLLTIPAPPPFDERP